VKNRKTAFYAVIAALIVVVALTPLVASAGNPAQGPSATPNDPIWLAFVVARAALEEKTGQDLTFVRAWTYEEFEFKEGIDSCRTLEEGEQAHQLFFGWRFTITNFSNQVYEVRTSFNYQIVVVCDQVTQAAAASATQPTNPNLPAPAAGSANMNGFELGGQVVGLYPETRAAMNQAKMKWVKRQLTVGQDGSAFIAEAHGAGYKVLYSVIGDKSQVMNASYHDTYAAYVAGLATAGADAIEIWNEMNIDREWPAGQINGANYAPLIAKAYNAIKAANPNTIVISGALAPTGYFGAAGCTAQGCNDDVYTQQMASAGVGNYADCIGLHYNEGIVSPQQSTGDPRGNYPTYYFGTMLNRAIGPFGNKKGCFTELGYVSPEGYGTLPGGFAWGQDTSVAEQAQWLAQAATLSAQSGKVRMMIVFNIDFTVWGADPQAGYAIIRVDKSCPACASLGSVMQ
jgi:hypothetical protein